MSATCWSKSATCAPGCCSAAAVARSLGLSLMPNSVGARGMNNPSTS
ncbi:Uncharacterised protein [Mycobacteroides abscessus subsp. abscessus]|nr:Uncharacterised protein [Mycobacteroides abscessus subsp. abscessus]